MTHKELNRHLTNSLRHHRRAAGLSQTELGKAVGYPNEGTIARHEAFHATPPLAIAISYEIVFRIPVAHLFAGLRDELEVNVESRLAQFEAHLGERSARQPNASTIARKLIWLAERKNPEYRPRT